MSLEQLQPNKPNFTLILILSCVALLVIFALAWIFIRADASHLGLRHHTKPPERHSSVVLPAAPGAPGSFSVRYADLSC